MLSVEESKAAIVLFRKTTSSWKSKPSLCPREKGGKRGKKRKQTKITPALINRTVPGLSVWMNVKSISSSAKTASAA